MLMLTMSRILSELLGAGEPMFSNMLPKNVMKQLGYKSIDSLLKRENMGELFAALRFAESPTWLNKFIEGYSSLGSGDFETRQINVITISGKRWGKTADAYVRKRR